MVRGYVLMLVMSLICLCELGTLTTLQCPCVVVVVAVAVATGSSLFGWCLTDTAPGGHGLIIGWWIRPCVGCLRPVPRGEAFGEPYCERVRKTVRLM